MDNLYEFFLGKWGLDWAAAIFMFVSIYRLGEHKRDGFLYAVGASVFWILFNIKVESAAGIVANAIILGMSVRSFRKAGTPSAGDSAGDSGDASGGTDQAEPHSQND